MGSGKLLICKGWGGGGGVMSAWLLVWGRWRRRDAVAGTTQTPARGGRRRGASASASRSLTRNGRRHKPATPLSKRNNSKTINNISTPADRFPPTTSSKNPHNPTPKPPKLQTHNRPKQYQKKTTPPLRHSKYSSFSSVSARRRVAAYGRLRPREKSAGSGFSRKPEGRVSGTIRAISLRLP